jgi:hypothetical protein
MPLVGPGIPPDTIRNCRGNTYLHSVSFPATRGCNFSPVSCLPPGARCHRWLLGAPTILVVPHGGMKFGSNRNCSFRRLLILYLLDDYCLGKEFMPTHLKLSAAVDSMLAWWLLSREFMPTHLKPSAAVDSILASSLLLRELVLAYYSGLQASVDSLPCFMITVSGSYSPHLFITRLWVRDRFRYIRILFSFVTCQCIIWLSGQICFLRIYVYFTSTYIHPSFFSLHYSVHICIY